MHILTKERDLDKSHAQRSGAELGHVECGSISH